MCEIYLKHAPLKLMIEIESKCLGNLLKKQQLRHIGPERSADDGLHCVGRDCQRKSMATELKKLSFEHGYGTGRSIT